MADSSAVEAEEQGNRSLEFANDIGSERPPSEKSKQEEHCSLSTQVLDSIDKLAQARADFMEDYRSLSGTYNRESSECQNAKSGSPSKFSNLDNLLQLSQKEGMTPDPDTKPGDSDGMSDKGLSSDVSECSMNWVNYQFNRLMSGKTNIHRNSTSVENMISTDLQEASTSKSVSELMWEYGTKPILVAGCTADPDVPTTCRMSNTMNPLKAKPMNTSQNNETLDTLSSDVEQLKRAGSSVDADSGDFMKAFSTKSSLSNIVPNRSRTSIGSHTHLPATEYKDLTDRHDSEVDFKLSAPSYRKESKDMRSDLPGLGFTFQKERERLLNVDTILRRTPFSSHTGTSEYQPWKSPHHYSSTFLSGFRSELYSTDHRSSNIDWKQSSSEMDNDNVRRSTSSLSYRNFGQYSSASDTSRPTEMSRSRDYGIPQPYSSAKSSPTRNYSKKIETPSTAKSSSSRFSRTTKPVTKTTPRIGLHNKKATQYNVRGNRNMSKALTQSQGFKQKYNSVVPPKKKCSSYIRDDEKENRDSNINKSDYNKDLNRVKFSKSSTYVGRGMGKYQPYQPTVIPTQDQVHLKRAKSEVSNVDRFQVMDCTLDDHETDAAKESHLNTRSWYSKLQAASRLAKGGKSTNARSAPKNEDYLDVYTAQAWTNQTQESVSDENDAYSLEGIKHTGKKPKGKPKKTMTRSLKCNKSTNKPPFK